MAAAVHSSVAPAQPLTDTTQPEEQVHWALSALFGTGWYKVDNNRSVFALRIPPKQTLRQSSLAADGTRQFGVEIHYPVTLGVSSLEEVPDFIDFDNYATISFVPGVEFEVPVSERLTLRPYLHLGYGWETESSEGAVIGYGGVRGRYHLADTRHRVSLLGEVYYAGYRPAFSGRGQFGGLMVGVEGQQSFGWKAHDGDALFLEWHLTYDWFVDPLEFHVDRFQVDTIRDQWELGLAVGKGDAPIEIGFMSFDHVGLGFRWSSNGAFDAIVLNFSSPFLN
jgi:hypothetical protein